MSVHLNHNYECLKKVYVLVCFMLNINKNPDTFACVATCTSTTARKDWNHVFINLPNPTSVSAMKQTVVIKILAF